MSQDDLIIANQAFPATRADVNSNLQALGSLMSGASAPATTYAYMWWADTTNGVLKQRDSSNASWIIRASLTATPVISKSANYTVALGDMNKTILCNAAGGAFAITFLASATLGNGWCVTVKKTDSSANAVTLTPNGAETIDGAGTLVLGSQYDSYTIESDGSNIYVTGFKGVITEARITLAANTTNDVSITKHGFCPTLPNDNTKFLNGIGGYTAPSTTPQVGFGAWVGKSLATIYQAATDGFVVCDVTSTNASGNIYTDSSSNPTTVRMTTTSGGASFGYGTKASSSIMCPVKKNDYYLCDVSSGTLYWIPLGS